MTLTKSSRNAFVVGAVVGIALAAASLVAFKRLSRPADDLSGVMRKDGFDVTVLRAPGSAWRGPEIGGEIDLNRLKGHDGQTLASAIEEGPVMLVVVNPTCAMCRTASDTMKDIRERLSSMRVPYYAVAFVPVKGDFYGYAKTLGVGTEAFLWSQDEGSPPDSLVNAAQPSHILIDRSGRVLRVWPGAHAAKQVRDRMGSQIVADTGVIMDAFEVMSRATQPNAFEKVKRSGT